MEPRISLITLGVADLGRSRAFYEELGWVGQEVQETVFIQAGALGVVLWDRQQLAADGGITDDHPGGFGGIVLAHNVRNETEVDAIMAAAGRAGAAISKPAGRTFYGGYAGHFADPDGHRWEIAHNPGLPLAADGSITIPDFSAGTP